MDAHENPCRPSPLVSTTPLPPYHANGGGGGGGGGMTLPRLHKTADIESSGVIPLREDEEVCTDDMGSVVFFFLTIISGGSVPILNLTETK